MSSPSLSPEHQDFYERFKSFWAAPSGERVAEVIAPDATIHFSGAGSMTGAAYAEWMAGTLAAMSDINVTPLDCAGNEDVLYISWESSATLHGSRRTYRGVDRFRLRDGFAIEEYVIFDTAVLSPEGRAGIDH